MGKRANLLDVMEIQEVLDEYISNVDYRQLGKMGDMVFLSLKNQLLEEKVEKLEAEVEELREKIERVEKKK